MIRLKLEFKEWSVGFGKRITGSISANWDCHCSEENKVSISSMLPILHRIMDNLAVADKDSSIVKYLNSCKFY